MANDLGPKEVINSLQSRVAISNRFNDSVSLLQSSSGMKCVLSILVFLNSDTAMSASHKMNI